MLAAAGERALVDLVREVEGKRVNLYSKSGLPFERKFPEVVEALKALEQAPTFARAQDLLLLAIKRD